MTTTDPGDEIILEPGDPGYVDPNAPAPEPAGAEGAAAPAPPGQNLEHQRNPGETEAEFQSRTRNVVVESQSPSDTVPNTPQIRPFPVETPPEEVEQPSSPQEGETPPPPAEATA